MYMRIFQQDFISSCAEVTFDWWWLNRRYHGCGESLEGDVAAGHTKSQAFEASYAPPAGKKPAYISLGLIHVLGELACF